ncbi:protein lethal(2)essential for life-like [Pectinophora gossypiella]|uniref:protein lethal(2)essential for life-like n=1 Tax=Pectinophora gossypiella TaxID=13191 RepID=UPI00214EA4E8|nr:protein lethal(2)essential for life-like [Pectinophora gossypiella]
MAFYPFYMECDRPRRPRQLLDQHFGLGLTPQDNLTIIAIPQTTRDYYRPWRNLQAAAQDVGSNIKEEKDKFQVNLDVQHFAPEEISVKTQDGYLVVEAKHEERQDEHGYIARSFVRKYPLPEGIQEESVTSKLSSDGVLTISAPLKAPPKNTSERVVPIIQTGPVKKQIEGAGTEAQKQG